LASCLKENHDLIEFRVAGNQMRLDIDGNLRKPLSVSDDQFKLIKPQSISMYQAHNTEFKVSKHLLNNNWVTEKWIKVEDVLVDGTIPRKKIKSAIKAEDFLKLGKLNLVWDKFEIKAPVFIHWEFDNWYPWYIEETDNKWISNFMVPTGTWKFFFTSGLSTSFISLIHRRYEGMEGPKELVITFDESQPAESTVKISISGFNEIFVDDNLADPVN